MSAAQIDGSLWLPGLRGYLVVTGTLNLLWETAQLPLYTIWNEGTAGRRCRSEGGGNRLVA